MARTQAMEHYRDGRKDLAEKLLDMIKYETENMEPDDILDMLMGELMDEATD